MTLTAQLGGASGGAAHARSRPDPGRVLVDIAVAAGGATTTFEVAVLTVRADTACLGRGIGLDVLAAAPWRRTTAMNAVGAARTTALGRSCLGKPHVMGGCTDWRFQLDATRSSVGRVVPALACVSG